MLILLISYCQQLNSLVRSLVLNSHQLTIWLAGVLMCHQTSNKWSVVRSEPHSSHFTVLPMCNNAVSKKRSLVRSRFTLSNTQHIWADRARTSQPEMDLAVHTLSRWGIPQENDPFDKTSSNPLSLCSWVIIALISLACQIQPQSIAIASTSPPVAALQDQQRNSMIFVGFFFLFVFFCEYFHFS